jgi:hypothetical protein
MPAGIEPVPARAVNRFESDHCSSFEQSKRFNLRQIGNTRGGAPFRDRE